MTAAWPSAPRTWSVGELTTAALINTELRDRMDWLKTPPQTSADLAAAVVLSTTSFADIQTNTITVVGTTILLMPTFFASCSTAIGAGILAFDMTVDGVSIGGGSGIGQYSSIGSGFFFNVSMPIYITGLTPGARTFKLRGKISSGTATIYGSSAGYLGRMAVREI